VIQEFDAVLPHGITLSCRGAGSPTSPVLLFLHGFPEGAFVWDAMLEHFADRYRCIAPNLRGFERSSAPQDVEAYRAKHLVGDIVALIDQQASGRVEALIAHDWGGAVAWNIGAQRADKLKRLVMINSPHPATFLRDLKSNAAQQRASAYMNFLCRSDAEDLLAADDFARLWPFFTGMGAADGARVGGAWLTESVRAQYRALWSYGLRGGCNYYRASPLRPPTPQAQTVLGIDFPSEFVTVKVPTRVVWAEDDLALPVGLLEGLDAFVPDLELVRVPGASHWIIHERPHFIAEQIELSLRSA
jgi:pimeloyl-ACP methyl ester carboxylesterase